MNVNTLMAHTTLRQMAAAQKLWKDYAGPDGPTFQAAVADGDMEAIAAIVAAKTGVTIDAALDAELDPPDTDTGTDDPGESTGDSIGVLPLLSPANGV